MTEPIYNATFDPQDDKVRIYSDRVSDELFDRLRKGGYQRAPMQECFFAVWAPGREDLALELCGEIGEEDTTLADRAADRADRFDGYSENAGARATTAYKRSNDLVKHIPFAQPVQPPGHHSRKGHLNTLKKSRRAMDKSVQESDKSKHWAGRSDDVLAHVARKFKPGAILRRIKKLEASKRGRERDRIMSPDAVYACTERWLNEHTETDNYDLVRHRVAGLFPAETDTLHTHMERLATARRTHADRWTTHYAEQIEFWQSVYDAGPGNTRPDFDAMTKGGWVKCRWGWGQVLRVNKGSGKVTSVSLDKETMSGQLPWGPTLVVKKDRIIEYRERGPAPIKKRKRPQ